jgi:hypothetical protein
MFSSAPAANPRSLLSTRRAAGEYVLQSARMVGDEDDYAIWQRGWETWRAAVARMLEEHFSDSPITRPDRRAALPLGGEGWKCEYEADLQDVGATLQLLTKLSEQLRNELAQIAEEPALALAR